MIADVPRPLSPAAGGGSIPGFMQLTAFMAMNMERHRDAHRKLYRPPRPGETGEAERIKAFYDEYFAVLDLTEEFYLETIERVFQRAELATRRLHLPRPPRRSRRHPQHGAADRRGRARRHLRARPDRGRPRPVRLAAAAPEAPPPAGECRPLRRLQRQALGAGDLSGGAQHDPGDGVTRDGAAAACASPGAATGPRSPPWRPRHVALRHAFASAAPCSAFAAQAGSSLGGRPPCSATKPALDKFAGMLIGASVAGAAAAGIAFNSRL